MKKGLCIIAAFALMLLLIPSAAAETAATVDLSVGELTWTGGDGQVVPGTELTVSVNVTNNGTADVTEHIAVTLSFGQELLRQATVEGVLAGETVTVTFDAWTATAGDRMLTVAADTTEAVAETDERNNTVQRNLRVAEDRLTAAYESTAEILEKAGMTDLIFNDDFDDPTSVDADKTKAAGYKWYITRPYGAPDLEAGDFAVENGIMTVKNKVPTYNYGLGTRDMDTRVGFDFNTGYLEVKLRIPRPRKNTEGEDGAPAIWALPTDRLYATTRQWVELDWMEYWGENYYTVTFHEMKNNEQGERVQWNKNSNYGKHGLGDGEWHVMGWLWQKGLFITYLDGEEVMRLAWAENEFSTPIQTVAQGELELGAFVYLDKQLMPITIGGSADNPMELDYVRVFDGEQTETYVPDVPVKDDGPVVMQMPAADFVYNYTTDMYGDAILTVTKENAAGVLAGEEVWLTLGDERRAEINALLKENGQSDYETLLAAAKVADAEPETTVTTVTTTTATTTAPTTVTTTTAVTATTATATVPTTVTPPEESPATGDTALPTAAMLLCVTALGVAIIGAMTKTKQQEP